MLDPKMFDADQLQMLRQSLETLGRFGFVEKYDGGFATVGWVGLRL